MQVRGVLRSMSSVLLKTQGSFVVMLFCLTSDMDRSAVRGTLITSQDVLLLPLRRKSLTHKICFLIFRDKNLLPSFQS